MQVDINGLSVALTWELSNVRHWSSMIFRDPAIATYVQTLVVFAGVAISALAIYFQRKSARDVAAKASAVEFILR